MKQIYTIFVAVLITASVFAQAPEKMSYQAVVRNSTDQLVINQGIGMQISILQTTATGTAIYVETHNTATNTNGLVTIEIGNGNVESGDFTTIDWANDIYFIKTEIDPTVAGGATYTITGTSQLLSVSYALHAKTAENITGGINETDPVYISSQAYNITAGDITNLSHLSNTNTGDQDVSGIALNEQAIQDTASQIRADFPDVSGFISNETDPFYTAWNKDYADLTNKPNIIDSITTVIDTTTQFVRSETQNLSDVLSENNDGGEIQIKNIANPTDQQDAVTLYYLENKIFELEFNLGKDTIADCEGNYYEIVKINEQYWFAENLRTRHYCNGNLITKVIDNTMWSNLSSGAYCWPQNDSVNYNDRGVLYNYYVGETGNICPDGWHIATKLEYEELINFLNPSAANKLKESGYIHWGSFNNSGATNSSGYTALPGYRGSDGSFNVDDDKHGMIWTSTENNVSENWGIRFDNYSSNVIIHTADKKHGYYIRCIKD